MTYDCISENEVMLRHNKKNSFLSSLDSSFLTTFTTDKSIFLGHKKTPPGSPEL